MILKHNIPLDSTLSTKLLPVKILVLMLLMFCLLIFSACSTPRIVVLRSDLAIAYGHKGDVLVEDSYIVPPARMHWILEQLSIQVLTNSVP